ncbi:hypothetical protein Aoki45_23300 [Algoriphagus sp. oki45]|nr:hypothetical protein Aoki45_23300 [Algoriphagus sp. oki45]
MYFLVAGLSIRNLLEMENGLAYQILFYSISGVIFIYGLINYLRQRKKIEASKKHVGDYQLDYLNKD